MGLFGGLRDKFLDMKSPLGRGKKPLSREDDYVNKQMEKETIEMERFIEKENNAIENRVRKETEAMENRVRKETEAMENRVRKETEAILSRDNQRVPDVEPEPVSVPKEPVKKSMKKDPELTLDVLDLSRVIDIHAEHQAVQAFDTEMGKERKGMFQKVKGFFARSFQRMGRDAWIDTKKRELVGSIKADLDRGFYTEDFLREHSISGDVGIDQEAYLNHEEGLKENALPPEIQATVDAWVATPTGSHERMRQTERLKAVIESRYPAITADIGQLEKSLLRLERGLISSEVGTIEAKLNVFDIGRIEQGNGKRKEGWFVGMADSVSDAVNNSALPDWMKQKVAGLVRHPNTAAVITALGTRAGVGAIAGATVATGFAGGFLLPIVAGSVTGGFFAGVRARREMRDRTAQIDRRGAMGLETGSESTDGKSTNSAHKTHTWQHPAMDLYRGVQRAKTGTPEDHEKALIAGINYLVKHKVGREKGINMLQYDIDKSVSRQHVEMIRSMNELFPGLVASFNDGSLFIPGNTSDVAQITKRIYSGITNLADGTMNNRLKEERNYAIKQGAIFGTTAAVVGGTVGAAIHGVMSLGAEHHVTTTGTSGTTITHYPDGLEAHQNVHREFWYDNKTPAPKFDHTELMIHTDKTGGWNVSHMLHKTATTLHHGSHTVDASDFSGKNIQAVVTPIKGGPSFILPIDAQGNIQIPPSMQDAFNKRTFAWLEVGEVKIGVDGKIDLHPIATVVGKGNMAFDVVTQYIPGTKTITEWDDQTPWIGVPFGANKYHELGKTEPLPPHGRLMPIIPPAKPKEETTSDITPSPDAPSSPATVAFVNDDSSSMDIPVTDTKNQKPEDVIDKEYEVSKRILGTFTPINDEVLSGSNGLLASSGGLLENQEHRIAMEHLLADTKKGGKTAMRAISAFYAKNGKIWLSKNAIGGHNSTHIGNILVGLRSSNGINSPDYLSRRLYEISGAHPMPEAPTIVLFHELGHQITKKARYAAADGDNVINSLINDVQELRDNQGAGITPLSSMSFYANRHRNNPEWNTQFWEDMAELMGLYLMGRKYVVKYLDDRISTRRSMKANITEGLRDRIMNVLDTSYKHYVG